MLKSATQRKFNSNTIAGYTNINFKIKVTIIFLKSNRFTSPLYGDRGSQLKFIPHAFHRGNAINTQFLPDLSDVNIYGAIADDDIVAPNLAENFIAQKNTPRS